MLKIAQIGAGYWGPNLIRNFLQLPDVEMTVCDLNEARLKKITSQYPKVKTTTSSAEVFGDKIIEAVVIALPAAMHFEYAKKALLAGKHVLVEKPLTMNTKDAKELIAIAGNQNKILMVGHTFLYNSAVRKVKEYIENDELGEIYYIFSQRVNLGKVRNDVNALWNLAPHDISIILYWLGEQPSHVSAKGVAFIQEGIEDVAFVSLDFPSGKLAHLHVSWLDPHKIRKMVIVGSKKMLVYDDVSADAKITLYDKGIDKKNVHAELPDIESFGNFQLMQRSGDVLIPKLDFKEPLSLECADFVESITSGKQPLSDGINGYNVINVLESAQESLKNMGQPVVVKI